MPKTTRFEIPPSVAARTQKFIDIVPIGGMAGFLRRNRLRYVPEKCGWPADSPYPVVVVEDDPDALDEIPPTSTS